MRLVAALLLSIAVVAAPGLAWAQNESDPDNSMWAGEDGDGDGLTDAYEGYLGSHPWSKDTDGDGLSDGDEVRQYGTHQGLADTDDDGMNDFDEIATHRDPLQSNKVPHVEPVTAEGPGEEPGEAEGCSILNLDLCFPRVELRLEEDN